MGRFLARWRIGVQIALLGGIGMLGMLVLMAITIGGAALVARHEKAAAAAREARFLDTRLQVAMLQARQIEKDFLLRPAETAVARHAGAMTGVAEAAGALASRVAAQPAIMAQVEQARADAGRYAAAFGRLVDTVRIVGMTEEHGLLGELRGSVHGVEAALKTVDAPNAQIAMLMMRRHEKDFIARLDPQYATAVRARLPEFVAALNAASVSEAVRNQVMAQMAAYQNAFARFAAGRLAELDAAGALGAVYTEIEPRLVALGLALSEGADAAVQQAAAAAAATQRMVLLAVAAVAVIEITLCWVVGRGIARPIIAVTRSMAALARGDLAAAVPFDRRRDEIGTMLDAVRGFKQSLVEAARLRDAQAASQARAAAEKHAALNQMAEQIECGAGMAVRDIGARTSAVIAIAEQMGELAGSSGAAAREAAAAAALALDNARTVAHAAEQLGASINEISAQIGHSSAVVGEAVAAGRQTRGAIEALQDRVGQIGAMADMIGDIAARTNLLALNATIEAARAGEAGRGFAVVANEVKQLAAQTRRSTEAITVQIAEVGAATARAVAAVGQIGSRIGAIDGISASIAAAVEQQGAATAEISRNVGETAAAVRQMAGLNHEVSRAAAQTGERAAQVLGETQVLDSAVAELSRTMIRIVRTSTEEVDRRQLSRRAVALPCQIEPAGGTTLTAQVTDLSEGGAGVAGWPAASAGLRGTMRIAGLAAALPFRVLRATTAAAHIAFEADTAAALQLRSFLEQPPLQTAA